MTALIRIENKNGETGDPRGIAFLKGLGGSRLL
jgi:hypothetical protein